MHQLKEFQNSNHFLFLETGRSHSPSEDGSDGTGDETLLTPSKSNKKEPRRRSFNHRKWRTPSSTPGKGMWESHVPASPTISESDQLLLSGGGKSHILLYYCQLNFHIKFMFYETGFLLPVLTCCSPCTER